MNLFRSNIKRILIIGIALTNFACSDSQAPNEENFKQAIEDYLSSTKISCFEVPNLPLKIKKSDLTYYININELLSIGLLRIDDPEKKEITISVTEKGKQALKTFEKSYMYATGLITRNSNVAFCYGEPKVVDITNFTEPASFAGTTFTSVKFTYTIENFADWAKNNAAVLNSSLLFKNLKSIKKPINSRADLILTKKGWVHRRLYNKL
ncbi:MAG: hypothetical protein QM500_19255 [Methylococcales bacterium]